SNYILFNYIIFFSKRMQLLNRRETVLTLNPHMANTFQKRKISQSLTDMTHVLGVKRSSRRMILILTDISCSIVFEEICITNWLLLRAVILAFSFPTETLAFIFTEPIHKFC
ncbi:hypothetical protein L9F63_003290, partial [Diploptera punctata]